MRSDSTQSTFFGSQPESRGSRVRVVAIGGVGCRAVSDIGTGPLNDVSVTFVDSSASALATKRCDSKILFEPNRSGSSTAATVAPQTDGSVKHRTEIRELVSGSDCVIVVASPASTIGSVASPMVVEEAKLSGAVVISVALMPLGFEPIKETFRAADTLAVLESISDSVFEVQRNDSKTLPEVLRDERDQVSRLVNTIAAVCSGDGTSNGSNAGDLNSVLQDGSQTILGSGNGYGHVGATEAVIEAIGAISRDLAPGQQLERALALVEVGPEFTTSYAATTVEAIERELDSTAEIHIVFRRSRLQTGTVSVSILGATKALRHVILHEGSRVGIPLPSITPDLNTVAFA